MVRPAGLELSRSLADELAPFGATVNTILPDFIETGENYEAFSGAPLRSSASPTNNSSTLSSSGFQ
jgi:NAD(P)-dependent dehydrogenase (short-subunit alcohol dehydrogenase family)